MKFKKLCKKYRYYIYCNFTFSKKKYYLRLAATATEQIILAFAILKERLFVLN